MMDTVYLQAHELRRLYWGKSLIYILWAAFNVDISVIIYSRVVL
jgi:hypothetical protein